jgi:hypothetical protein
MNAVRLSDLRELLQSAPFAAWWAEYSRAVVALREARAHHEDLSSQSELMELRSELAQRAAIDTFSAAGEAEDRAAAVGADGQALENRALELVGSYEEQRFRTSDLWYRLGGAERTVEDRREALAAAAKEPLDGARARPQAEAALKAAERQHEVLRTEYASEDGKRARLWDDVEATWSRSFERSLFSAEHAVRSRRIRRDAERLFKEAEERRARAKQLRLEAEAAERAFADAGRARTGLLAQAGERFGCTPGDTFLYWRHNVDKRAAFAVALADDPDGANLQVKALGIYTVGRPRGVSFLEPAREGLALTLEEGDRRFEEYFFLGPRRGEPRKQEGPPSPGSPKP